MRKKYLFYLILLLFSLFVFIWFSPITHSIPKDGFCIEKYFQPGKVTILCKSGGNTGPYWRIHDFIGINDLVEYDVDISGNVPENSFRYPSYIYYSTNTFLFIGTFDENEDLFIVEEWYFVGDIERLHSILLYPPKGLNWFEIKGPFWEVIMSNTP